MRRNALHVGRAGSPPHPEAPQQMTAYSVILSPVRAPICRLVHPAVHCVRLVGGPLGRMAQSAPTVPRAVGETTPVGWRSALYVMQDGMWQRLETPTSHNALSVKRGSMARRIGAHAVRVLQASMLPCQGVTMSRSALSAPLENMSLPVEAPTALIAQLARTATSAAEAPRVFDARPTRAPAASEAQQNRTVCAIPVSVTVTTTLPTRTSRAFCVHVARAASLIRALVRRRRAVHTTPASHAPLEDTNQMRGILAVFGAPRAGRPDQELKTWQTVSVMLSSSLRHRWAANRSARLHHASTYPQLLHPACRL